jgi:hypothetical protein
MSGDTSRFSDPEDMNNSLSPAEESPNLSPVENEETPPSIEGGATGKSLIESSPASENESHAIKEMRDAIKRKEKKLKEIEKELELWKVKAQSKIEEDDDPAPDPTKYPQEHLHKYIEDLSAHSARKALKESEKRHRQQREEEHKHNAENSWKEKVQDARSKYKDFDKVISESHTEHAPHVVDEVKKSEHGADILYHLASHPEKASKLNSLSPHETMREIAKLEGLIESGRQNIKPQVSSAPSPHSPVRESATGTHIPTDDDVFGGEMDAYRANRDRMLKKK